MATRKPKPANRKAPDELTLLFEISQALDRSLDIRDAVGPVLELIPKHTGMMRGTLSLLDRATGEIFIEAAHGLSAAQRRRGKYRSGEGVLGRVVATGKPAIVPRVSEEPMFLDKTGARKNVARKDISYLCVPIKMGREVVGALSADRLFDESKPLDEDVRLLSIIASMIAQAVRLRQVIQEERRRLEQDNVRLQDELRERFRPSNIVGTSHAMMQMYEKIAQVCGSDTTVLITGESGTGKELAAHAIHYNSPRAKKPFVKVNCAALPETVIESELFGHEKGAFTGALARKLGRFEQASGGTIFLDEIGDFSPTVQIKLLRVVQERQFERVGGLDTIDVDVRVIAATNRDLEQLVADGEFRADLFYRLHVFPIHLPALRDRRTDIPLLADHFVEKCAKATGKRIRRISTPAIDMLMAYHWPGNVRELENCIERAVLVSTDSVIHGHHLPPTLQTAEASGTGVRGTLAEQIDTLEREMILEALKQSRGNQAQAAELLGITERIMGLRVKKHAIDPFRFRVRGQVLRREATRM